MMVEGAEILPKGPCGPQSPRACRSKASPPLVIGAIRARLAIELGGLVLGPGLVEKSAMPLDYSGFLCGSGSAPLVRGFESRRSHGEFE